MRRKFKSITEGATIPSMSIKQFGEIEIFIHPLEKQKKIAELLELYNVYINTLGKKESLIKRQKEILIKKFNNIG